jgi:hypothetical protein
MIISAIFLPDKATVIVPPPGVVQCPTKYKFLIGVLGCNLLVPL